MLDLEAVNADCVMKDTPLGDLEVVIHQRRYMVRLSDGRIVYEMGRWKNPWSALHGKHMHEQAWLFARIEEERQERLRSEARESEQVSLDLIHAQERLERRDPDFKSIMQYIAGDE